jgi:hypothetical protein
MTEIREGDYVLATKYNDGDPGDAWAVGFYHGRLGDTDRHLVGGESGPESYRAGGYRRVGLIDRDFGAWLLSVAKALESSPPGTVNLWGMQEGTCRMLERVERGAYGS